MHARRRGRAPARMGSAAPKEQPPRKLSGKRTAGGRALWKAAAGFDAPAAHRRSKPRRHRSWLGGRVNLSGSTTEGAAIGRFGVRSVGGVPVTLAAAAAPLKRTPLHALHLRARRPDGAVRRLRDAGAVSDRHPRTSICTPARKPGSSTFRIWGRCGSPAPTRSQRSRRSFPAICRRWRRGACATRCCSNEAGGILDDLMVTRLEDGLFLVVNAARKEADLAHLRARLGSAATVEPLADRGAAGACRGLPPLPSCRALSDGIAAARLHDRDGDERSPACNAWSPAPAIPARTGSRFRCRRLMPTAVAEMLLAQPEVQPIGLGARDSLRLEAGLCLYGHDIDETTTPIEAGLAWTIGKRRRAEGGFPGAAVMLRQLAEGPARRRVGIRPDGRAPAREDTPIVDPAGKPVGRVTSGGFGPSVGGPIAMGYVDAATPPTARPSHCSCAVSPGPARVAPLPFVPHRYYRG